MKNNDRIIISSAFVGAFISLLSYITISQISPAFAAPTQNPPNGGVIQVDPSAPQGSLIIGSAGSITTGIWSATPISISKGGTGATVVGGAGGALSNLGAAASGANNDITSLSALTGLTVSAPSPVIILKDSDSPAATQYGYISLQDNGNVERGWFGFGRGDLDLGIQNNNSAGITFHTAGTEKMKILSGGNVGIGTATPGSKLVVVDNNESTSLTNFTQSITNAGLLVQTDYTASAYTPGIFWATGNSNPTKPKAGIWLLEDGSGTDMYFGTSNSYATGITNNGLILDQSGNVGIGTVAPGARLHINEGSVYPRLTAISETAMPPLGLTIQAGPGGANTQGWLYPYGARLSVYTGGGRSFELMSTTYPDGQLAIRTASGTPSWDNWKLILDSFHNVASSGNLQISGAGNHYISAGSVGIGTTSPDTTLDIESSAANPLRIYRNGVNTSLQTQNNASSAYFGINTSGNAVIGHSLDQTNAPFQITSTGNVGIGTTGPSQKLHIADAPNGGGFMLASTQSGGASGPFMMFRSWTGTTNSDAALGYGSDGKLAFQTTNGGTKWLEINTATNAVNIPGALTVGSCIGCGGSSQWTTTGSNIYYNTGNVGIGISAPGAKLEVGGNIKLSLAGSPAIPTYKITGVATPIANDSNDTVATKGYVDAAVSGAGGILSTPFSGRVSGGSNDINTYTSMISLVGAGQLNKLNLYSNRRSVMRMSIDGGAWRYAKMYRYNGGDATRDLSFIPWGSSRDDGNNDEAFAPAGENAQVGGEYGKFSVLIDFRSSLEIQMSVDEANTSGTGWVIRYSGQYK